MSNCNGHRWSKFWWRDHQGDAALRACSLAARGYWMELLCVAHEANPVGHVLLNGRKPTARQIAAITGSTEKEAKKLEAELEEAGVFSRLPDGTIFCRRMVRDAATSDAGREHIAKRWNGEKSTHPPNSPPNRGPTDRPTRQPNGEANREATSDPESPPITKKLEVESEEEPEEEGRKFKTLTYASPVLARVAEASETPPVGTYGGEPEPEPASNALQLATKNLVGKVARKLESSGVVAIGKRAQRTPMQQIAGVLYGEVIEPDGPRRGPMEPVRTVEQQLAALQQAIAEEAAAKAALEPVA
jgi:hypothetical protein